MAGFAGHGGIDWCMPCPGQVTRRLDISNEIAKWQVADTWNVIRETKDQLASNISKCPTTPAPKSSPHLAGRQLGRNPPTHPPHDHGLKSMSRHEILHAHWILDTGDTRPGRFPRLHSAQWRAYATGIP